MGDRIPTPVIECGEDHVYRVDGRITPGVTETLGIFCDYARVPKDVLEFKRQLGRAVHKAIEYFEDGVLDMDTVDDAVLPYLESWQAFKAAKPLRVVRAEFLVYSKRYGYCGRGDLAIEFLDAPGKQWMVDAKCVYALAPETSLQTAAYAQAYFETFGQMIHARAALQLLPDGTQAKFQPYIRPENRNDLAVFLNALNLRNWMLNHR